MQCFNKLLDVNLLCHFLNKITSGVGQLTVNFLIALKVLGINNLVPVEGHFNLLPNLPNVLEAKRNLYFKAKVRAHENFKP